MSKITCLIVDDEEMARLRLRRLIAEFPELEVIGEAENGIAAVEKINKLDPDLVFLDIQMPGMNGFEVLKKLPHQPVIIFTTAFDKFAIQAFDENAVAYLLKPIEHEKLERAVKKSMALLGKPNHALYEKLMQYLGKKQHTHFISRFGNKVKLIPADKVSYIEARDKYACIHLVDGSEYITDDTLSGLESKTDLSFLRIHRSIVLNINFIHEAEKAGQGRFIFSLKDAPKTQLQSSSGYAAKIRDRLGL